MCLSKSVWRSIKERDGHAERDTEKKSAEISSQVFFLPLHHCHSLTHTQSLTQTHTHTHTLKTQQNVLKEKEMDLTFYN